jgi:hypothetical protein
MPTGQITVVTANIMGNPKMSQKQVYSDLRKIKGFRGGDGLAVLFQEISHPRYKYAVWRTFHVLFAIAFRVLLATPIAIDRSTLHRVGGKTGIGKVRTHKGRRNTTPARYFNWITVAFDDCPDIPAFVLMNTHFISGAWNDKDKSHKEWRKEMWLLHWEKMKDQVLEFYAQGLTVVFAGDFNRVTVEKFHPNQRWLVGKGSIDKIAVLEAPGGVRVSELAGGRIGQSFHTDHTPRFVDLRLRPSA